MQVASDVSYQLIGLMSGTSLDGVDLCHVEFKKTHNKWEYSIRNTHVFEFPQTLLNTLKKATQLNGLELFKLDKDLGVFFGECINRFISEKKINNGDIVAVSSHGQTIFHQPNEQLTVQIGCGEAISRVTGLPTINDFRKKDVLYGGQGAPLVPIGDKLLFSNQADSFLNIGGFANYSKVNGEQILAGDICMANCIINYLTRKINLEYDRDGMLASNGKIIKPLLEVLNNLPLYQMDDQPSLGWEWVVKNVVPLIEKSSDEIEDLIATVTEHSAMQIARVLMKQSCKKVFVTGGGAKNRHLMKRIGDYFEGEIIIPSVETIDFKEALIFAFLGALYLEDEPNCVPSVTGSSKAVVGGVYHKP